MCLQLGGGSSPPNPRAPCKSLLQKHTNPFQTPSWSIMFNSPSQACLLACLKAGDFMRALSGGSKHMNPFQVRALCVQGGGGSRHPTPLLFYESLSNCACKWGGGGLLAPPQPPHLQARQSLRLSSTRKADIWCARVFNRAPKTYQNSNSRFSASRDVSYEGRRSCSPQKNTNRKKKT